MLVESFLNEPWLVRKTTITWIGYTHICYLLSEIHWFDNTLLRDFMRFFFFEAAFL